MSLPSSQRSLASYHRNRTDLAARVRRLVYDGRKRSKKLGATFRLSKAWIVRAGKQDACAVTGIMFDLTKSRGNANPLGPSLDRIDASKGYTDKNTRLVTYFVNVAKGDWSEEQFRTLVIVAASNMRR